MSWTSNHTLLEKFTLIVIIITCKLFNFDIQEGHTLTEIYSKLVDTTQALQEKKNEVDRLKFDLNQVRAAPFLS
jgi:hypothetical protein